MKKLVAAFIALQVAGTPVFSQQRPQQRPARRVLQDAVLGFYVSEFQQQAEVSGETFAKILPFMQQFVQDRFEVSQRRGSDEDLKRAIRDFDAADADFQSNQEKFLSRVDPLLDARQQAKLRIFQVMADRRMRQLLTSVRNPNWGQ